MKNAIILLLYSFIFLLYAHSQDYSKAYNFGPRIPSFNKKNYEYLDTVFIKNKVIIDSLSTNFTSNKNVDTFQSSFIYRELVFTLPEDSIFTYVEPLEEGGLLKSKRYGFWLTYEYDFFGNPNNSYCKKSKKTVFYFNNIELFDASFLYGAKLRANYKGNSGIITFNYYKDSLSAQIEISFIWVDSLSDYNCKLVFKDKILHTTSSNDFDEVLNMLYFGHYDREIFGSDCPL